MSQGSSRLVVSALLQDFANGTDSTPGVLLPSRVTEDQWLLEKYLSLKKELKLIVLFTMTKGMCSSLSAPQQECSKEMTAESFRTMWWISHSSASK